MRGIGRDEATLTTGSAFLRLMPPDFVYNAYKCRTWNTFFYDYFTTQGMTDNYENNEITRKIIENETLNINNYDVYYDEYDNERQWRSVIMEFDDIDFTPLNNVVFNQGAIILGSDTLCHISFGETITLPVGKVLPISGLSIELQYLRYGLTRVPGGE